ncbi:hypothetical protein RHSIM_Rhsim10G0168500 [Rhododendron simsii]|uniref:Uncharacterized protein n=1 Tax=Rhododendron simsii TaxID=118357 RepID=A0A834GG51_RHOSS|nr:hypothetical protein RHSIM_Rhsim10G0168500 [Rhododendron simsii]
MPKFVPRCKLPSLWLKPKIIEPRSTEKTGYKSQWPELKGVRAVTAKQIIEKENPFVKAWIYPEGSIFNDVICPKRVLLLTPENDCPNGRVSNSPFVG